ncbi:RnfH family protein [Marinihelvus fidelis]|uniref:UPF0125 protein F3N42_02365 n=1 Tax=Marinihelvus fidelis TaxID=2613842 RepID=A0A5N0TDQ1_9GAMM|nr:RnfH family protein [Marinihelvus fidelis]KAA9133223.1 RnfH family protein [Marinihelvus fidelis]
MQTLRVEVTYALPGQQWLLAVDVPEGTTLEQAIVLSGIHERVPGLEIDAARVGIFGKKAALDQVLNAGDRVEIYRPLQVDPKEVRRARARAQQEKESGTG